MRLIDADALWEKLDKIEQSGAGLREIGLEPLIAIKDAKTIVNDFPNASVFNRLWNALYAKEDKLEKRYIGTTEHDNWFMVYRPWLQDGFGIAIKVLSELSSSEENINDN